MSQHNTLAAKRGRRVAKALRSTPPAYVDLIAWVKMRLHCSTRKAAQVIMTGCLKVDSHTVGVENLAKGGKRFVRYIPAEQARTMRVVTPEGL